MKHRLLKHKGIPSLILMALSITSCSFSTGTNYDRWIAKPGMEEGVSAYEAAWAEGEMYLSGLPSIHNLTKDQMKLDINYLLNFFERYVPDFMVLQRNKHLDPINDRERWFQRVDEVKKPLDFYIIIEEISSLYRSSNTALISPFALEDIPKFPNHPDESVLSDPAVTAKNQEFKEVLLAAGRKPETKSKLREDNVFTGVTEDGKTAYLKLKSFDIEGTAEDGTVLGVSEFLSHLNDFETFIIDIRGNQSFGTAPWRDEIVGRLIREEATVKSYIGRYDDPVSSKVFNYYLQMDENVKNLTEIAMGNRYSLDELELTEVEELPDNMLARDLSDVQKLGAFLSVEDRILPEAPINFAGRIFLLQDSQVLASGDTFSHYLRSLDLVTSVGKPAKGDGVGRTFGLRYISLPYSGLIYSAQTGYGFNHDGTPNTSSGTPTDIFQENGPELDYVLDLIKQLEPEAGSDSN